jgi:hypothetical protein
MAMRRGSLAFCLIIAVVSMAGSLSSTLGGVAQSLSPPTSSQEQSVTKFLRDYLGNPRFGKDETTRFVIAFVDLKDDGTQEVIVYVTGRNWCGSGGYSMYVLLPRGASYEFVAKTTITRPPIRVLASKSHG